MLANLLGFLGTLVLARVLFPEDFGIVALATSLLALLSAFNDASLSSALIQHRDPTPEHYHTAWSLALLRGLIVGGVFYALSWPAAALYQEPKLQGVMAVLSLTPILSGLSNPRAIMKTRELIFWQQFMLQVSQKLIVLLVSITLALTYRNYWALVIGTVVGQFGAVVLSYTVMRYRPKFDFSHVREIFSFSLWLTMGQFINTLNSQFDNLLIGGFFGRPALGVYSVGNNLAAMPTRELTAPLTTPLFPAFSRIADSPGRLAAAYQRAQTLTTTLALPAGIGMAVVAEPLVRLTMGEKWLPAVLVAQVLAAMFALATLGSLAPPLAMATNNTRILFTRSMQGFCMRVPIIAAGMMLAGFEGVVYSRILVGFLSTILHMHVVKRITGLSLWAQLRPNVRSLASAGVMAAVVLLVYELMGPTAGSQTGALLELIAMTAAGVITYPLVHVILWVAASRPDGSEREILSVIAGFSARVRERSARNA